MKKIKNAFGGVIVGILFIIIGAVLLWWNEGNNVKNIKTVDEARANLVQVDSTDVDNSNDGKLISTNGTVNVIDENIKDSIFGVKIDNTAKVKRIVEMYQWDEESDTDDDTTTYTYKKEWSTTENNSEFFHESGHDNPSMPYEGETFLANDVMIGSYSLSKDMVALFGTDAVLALTSCEETCEYSLPTGYIVSGNYITNSSNLSTPEIGDVRISYVYNNDKEASVLGKQSGSSIVPYISDQNKEVAKIDSGIVSGEEMINEIESSNNVFKWVMRLIGLLLLMIGFAALLNPIATITSFIPLIGKSIGGFISLIGSLMGLGCGLLIIAVAWIRFRPLIGIGLLLVVGIITALVITMIKKKKASAPEQTDANVQAINTPVQGGFDPNTGMPVQSTPIQPSMPEQVQSTPVQPSMPEQVQSAPVQPSIPEQVQFDPNTGLPINNNQQ